ncbi:hypothetical protein SBA2_440002 [Acidobacteriia bacterium SbA2]|nr:hypothetical protein SBA2_440002 [Acidobacteriia bacterium SbA2]
MEGRGFSPAVFANVTGWAFRPEATRPQGLKPTRTFALPQPSSFAWISLDPNLGVTEK